MSITTTHGKSIKMVLKTSLQSSLVPQQKVSSTKVLHTAETSTKRPAEEENQSFSQLSVENHRQHSTVDQPNDTTEPSSGVTAL